ncbi:MAG: DUF692 family multinuclear iron-containing protein [Verrucomicrobiales bacterium]
MLEDAFLQASLPLFEDGVVDALEWSFDVGWARPSLPEWVSALLDEYGGKGALVGHGVTYSALSGKGGERAEQWLEYLREELKVRRYVHLSEHFGFMAGGDFHRGTPLPVPLTENTLCLGCSRLRALAEVVDCPVGLENLALALSMTDVADQGRFLAGLLESVDGFLVLDLHNVYCQMMNFNCSADQILSSYPLERVREMHISGGSWMEAVTARGTPIRRDTHDDDVPEEVFALLRNALPRCPNTEVVIFERLGDTLDNPGAQERMRTDFLKMRSIVSGHE